MKTAVIAGATGMIGSELCRQLARDDSGFDRVVALTRRPLDFSLAKLVEQPADFGRLDRLDIGPIDTAFCTLGTTMKTAGSPEAFRLVDYDYALAFARFARKAGARTFVLLTSVNAAATSRNFYLQVKGELELAVDGVGFENLYILRPSFLIGNRQEVRTGEKLAIAVANTLQFAFIGALRKYRPIRAQAVAAGMCRVARRPEGGRHIWQYSEIVEK